MPRTTRWHQWQKSVFLAHPIGIRLHPIGIRLVFQGNCGDNTAPSRHKETFLGKMGTQE